MRKFCTQFLVFATYAAFSFVSKDTILWSRKERRHWWIHFKIWQEVVKIWIFVFPAKQNIWMRSKELCWEGSAVSFNFFLIFLSSSKNAQKFKLSLQLPDLEWQGKQVTRTHWTLKATSKWFWARLQQEARPRPYQLHHLPLCLGLVSSRMIKFALGTPKISRQCVNNPRSWIL